MAARPVIRVEGWRETARALNQVNRGAKAAMFAGMRKGAEPIAMDARSRLDQYRGISLDTIRPSARVTGVYVVQRAKKVTGKRPDFGALQMRKGFIPALEAGQDDVVKAVETALDALIVYSGLQGETTI